MPLYDYKCKDHGIFYGLQTIKNFDHPQPCPQCGTQSPRVIIIPPSLVDPSNPTNIAKEKNEKARFEPLHSTKDQRQHDKHHSSCCGSHKVSSASNLMYTAKGEKMFPSMRPWMISH